MEIIKGGAETAQEKEVITKEMVDAAKTTWEDTRAENKKKVYGVDVKTEETKNIMLEYLDKNVSWEGPQAFGIPKVYDAIEKEEVKDGKIYMAGLEVEALAFYLAKMKGTGRKAAQDWNAMNDAISVAYELRARDNKAESNLKMKWEALKDAHEQGLALDGAEAGEAPAES